MATRTMRVGDRNPLQVALREESGTPVDLSGSTVTARVASVATGLVIVDDRACVIDDAADGLVTLEVAADDTAAGREGIHDVTFRVTTAGGLPRTFPARGPLKLVVLPR